MSDKKYKIKYVLHNDILYLLSEELSENEIKIFFTNHLQIDIENVIYVDSIFDDRKYFYNIVQFVSQSGEYVVLLHYANNTIKPNDFINNSYFLMILLRFSVLPTKINNMKMISKKTQLLEYYFKPYNELAKKLLREAIAEVKQKNNP